MEIRWKSWNGMEIGWSQYGNQVEVEWRLDKSRMEWNKSKKSDNSGMGDRVGEVWCKNRADLLSADVPKADAVCSLAIPIFVKYPDCI